MRSRVVERMRRRVKARKLDRLHVVELVEGCELSTTNVNLLKCQAGCPAA